MVADLDKNLRQCLIERSKYHHLVYYQHLDNSTAYQQLSKDEANQIVHDAIADFRALSSEASW